jgi:hypothetical protein
MAAALPQQVPACHPAAATALHHCIHCKQLLQALQGPMHHLQKAQQRGILLQLLLLLLLVMSVLLACCEQEQHLQGWLRPSALQMLLR